MTSGTTVQEEVATPSRLVQKPLLKEARKLGEADPERQLLLLEADRLEAALLREPIELPFEPEQAGSSAIEHDENIDLEPKIMS